LIVKGGNLLHLPERENSLPQMQAIPWMRKKKLNHLAQTTRKGPVNVSPTVGGEDYSSWMLLCPLQQIIYLGIRISIVGISCLRTFAEKSICLIEKEYDIVGIVNGHDAARILLSFTDILVDYALEVNSIEVKSEIPE
jgi:hypothetical protein